MKPRTGIDLKQDTNIIQIYRRWRIDTPVIKMGKKEDVMVKFQSLRDDNGDDLL